MPRLILLTLWLVAAIAAAHYRSFWCDELARLHEYDIGFIAGLKELFGEPSPFSPGDVVLNWFAGKTLSWALPPEIWARVPGIAWGAATLWLSYSFGNRWLPLFVAGSVPLFMLSVEMRPYASLYFSGALALRMLHGKLTSPVRAAAWLTVIFSHLYGICFIALAGALRRQWLLLIVGGLYAAAILSQYHIPAAAAGSVHYNWLELLRQSLGSLGNPHKAGPILALLATAGMLKLLRDRPRFACELGLLFCATVFAPIAATMRAGYFFVPRQIVGGSFTFLFLGALGLSELERLKPRSQAMKGLAWALVVGTAAVPWILSIALMRPPFPNQPFHRFRQISEEIVKSGKKSVLFLDACNQAGMEYYISRALGSARKPTTDKLVIGDLELTKACWPNGLCLYELMDMRFCSSDPGLFLSTKGAAPLLSGEAVPLELIVHSFPQLPYRSESVKTARSW